MKISPIALIGLVLIFFLCAFAEADDATEQLTNAKWHGHF
jgi:hypothetical protein